MSTKNIMRSAPSPIVTAQFSQDMIASSNALGVPHPTPRALGYLLDR